MFQDFSFLIFSLFVDFSNFFQFLLKFLKMKLFLIFESSDWLPLGSELWKGLDHWPSESNLRKLLFDVLLPGFEPHQIRWKKKNVIGQIRTRDLKTIPKAELKSVIVPNISPNNLISITIIDFWFDSFWISSFASVNFKFKLSSSPRDFKFSSNSRLKILIKLVDFCYDIIKWGASS